MDRYTDTEPLLNTSKCSLEKTPNPALLAFCSKHNLIVAVTGKRKRPIKQDYVDSILSYVSDFVRSRAD